MLGKKLYFQNQRRQNEQKEKGGNICFLRSVQKGKGGKMKITEELANIENIIDVLPHQINPCKICEHAKNWSGDSADFDMEYCSFCCWYYDSYFKMGAINEI